MPAQAIEAIEDDVGGLLFRIIDLRIYARAKQVYEESLKEPDMSKRPQSPVLERVKENVFAIVKEKIARAKGELSSQST